MKSAAQILVPRKAFLMNSVLDLLRVIRGSIPLVSLLFVLLMGGVVAGVYLRKPAFDSTAKVLVNFEGMGVSLSRAEYQLGTTQILATEVITSQSEILRSRSLVEKVIDGIGVETLRDPPPKSLIGRMIGGLTNFVGNAVEKTLQRLGLATKLNERDALCAKLSKSLSVYPVRQSHIMIISVRWHRPEIARVLLDKVMEVYFAMSKEIGQRSSSYEAFAEQTRRLSAELSKAEEVMFDFKLKNNLQDLPREKQLMISRIEKLTGLSQGLEAIAAPVDTAPEATIASGEGDGATIAQVSSLRTQLTSLRVEQARLRVSSTAQNPVVKEIEGQIAQVEKSLAAALVQVEKTLYKTRSRLRSLNEAEANYERIRRDVEMAGDAYQTYRKVTEDRRAMQSRNSQINVQVIDPPSLPLEPAGPARLTLLLAGLIFALIFSLVLTLLFHYLRNWSKNQIGDYTVET